MDEEIRNKVANILEELSDVQRRTGMYIGEVELGKLEIFLMGFNTALIALRFMYSPEDQRAAMQEFGWERHSDGCISQMRQRGLSERQMINDLLEIEKSAWKHYLDRVSEEA